MLRELEENEKDLRENIGLLEYAEAQFLDRDRVLFFLHRFAKLDPESVQDRRKLIQYFVNAVYVYDDHLKIIINASDSTTTVPFKDLPDISPGSDNVTCRVQNRRISCGFLLFQGIKKTGFRRSLSERLIPGQERQPGTYRHMHRIRHMYQHRLRTCHLPR